MKINLYSIDIVLLNDGNVQAKKNKREQNGAYLHTEWYNTEIGIRFSFMPLNWILGKAIELSNGFRLKRLRQRHRDRERARRD